MKLAMVSNFFPPEAHGGAETYAADLASELATRGLEVDVVTSTRFRERVERRGNLTVRFFRCVPPLERLTSDVLGYNFNPWTRRLVRFLANGGFDLVHVHNINSSIMLWPLLKAIRKPAVCHVHDHWPVCYRGVLFDTWHQRPCTSVRPSCCFNPGRRVIGAVNLAFRNRLIPRFERSMVRFIVPSQHMLGALAGRGFTDQEKIRLVRLGVDLSKLPVEGSARSDDFLFVGRLIKYKNPQLAVELLSSEQLDPRVSFRIVGGGPKAVMRSASILTEVQRRRIEFLGPKSRQDVLVELSQARGLLVPSLVPENSPLVVYEALACGTPVLCSDFGGTKELVRESGAGHILPVGETTRWKDAIESLLDGHFAELSRRAASYARANLGIARSADGVMSVYDEVTA